MPNEPTTPPRKPQLTDIPGPTSISTRRDDSLFGKIIESKIFWTFFVILALGLPLARSVIRKPLPLPPVLGSIGDFKLTNQDNRVVTAKDFEGSVFVVDFIFTTCPDVCPRLTAQMTKLQSRMLRSYPAIRLVSISVDPEHDTPQVLRDYGNKYKAEFRLWSFLTGPLTEIQNVVVNGFKMSRVLEQTNVQANTAGAATSAPNTTPAADVNLYGITHGENFVIVDQVGQIRAYKQANNEEDLNQIIKTVALLANTRAIRQAPVQTIDVGNPLTR